MSKLYKVEMYILDLNDMYDNMDEVIESTERKSCADFIPFNIQEVEFEWDDDIDLNHKNDIDTFRNYFKED